MFPCTCNYTIDIHSSLLVENNSTWILFVHRVIFIYKPSHKFVHSFENLHFKMIVNHGSGKKGMRVLGRQYLEAEKLVLYGWGEREGTRKRESTGHSF